MTQTVGNENSQEHTGDEQRNHGEASDHGHTGEGAASALAHLIKQGERRKRSGESGEELTSHG